MIYQAKYFEHRCLDHECGGEVLERWPSGIVRVRRIALEILPKVSKLFNTLEDAQKWAKAHDGTVNFNVG